MLSLACEEITSHGKRLPKPTFKAVVACKQRSINWATTFLNGLFRIGAKSFIRKRAKSEFILISSAFEEHPNSLPAALVQHIRRLDPKLRSERVSKYRSIFDRLVLTSAPALEKKNGESEAEAIYRAVLSRVLADNERYHRWSFVQEYPLRLLPTHFEVFAESEQLFMLHNARLDFLVFDTINNEPLVAIEVDGAAYHQEGTIQAERDRKKDSIMRKLGIPLQRFRTDSVSGDEIKILEAVLAKTHDNNRSYVARSVISVR